jgi:putative ABC transport system permease protein
MRFLTFIAKNLIRRRMRTILTVLAIAVSVGTMAGLLSVSRRFSDAMEESFRQRGVDLVVMAAGVINQLSSDIDESVVEEIRKIPGVKAVAPGLVELVEVDTGSTSVSVMVQGWPPENFTFNELPLVSGNWLDFNQRGKVLLGSLTAENLKKGVGDTLQILQQPFEVTGIYDSFVVYEKGGMIMPLKELQELMGRQGSVTGISVVCDAVPDKADVVQKVKEQIESISASGRKKRLVASTVQDYLKSAAHLQIAKGMAWLIAAIAMVIGTIGMMNTMVMSVLERVHEIGILRAVGWPRTRVVHMVLGESLLLVAIGTVVGILGAAALVSLLTQVPAVSGFIDGRMSGTAIGQALAVAAAMGLVGGIYPALRAARLDPTEALRYE